MNDVSALILAISLIIIMFGMGLSLTIKDFARVAQQPKAVIIGLVNQMVLLPLIGFLLVTVFNLRPEIAIGLMILAACPGGATSNLIAHLAKGDTALSVTLTAVASLISIVTIPFIIQFSLTRFLGESQQIELNILQMIGQLLVIVIIPVIIGMLLRAKATAFALRMDKPVRTASALLLGLIIIGLLIKEKHNLLPYFQQSGLQTIILNITTMALGFTTALLFKLKRAQAISISVESGIQNSTLAITIATVTLQNTAFAIPAAIYSLVMYIAAITIIIYGRKTYRKESLV